MAFSREEIWWSVGQHIDRLCHWWRWYGHWHHHRSRSFLHRVDDPVRKMLDQSSKECNTRQRQRFYDLVNVYVFCIGNICYGKKYSEHSLVCQINMQEKIFHLKTDVRHMCKIDNRTIRRDLCVEQWIGKILDGKKDYLWSTTIEVISLSHAKIHVLSDSSHALERWTRTLNQILFGKNSSSQCRILDTIDGELTISPGFTKLQFCNKVQEFITKMSDKSRKISNTYHRLYSCEKIFTRKDGHSLDWDQEKWCSIHIDWMGQICWIDDDRIWRKRTPSFPCHDSIVLRNAQKRRRWKIANDTNLFFAQLFLLIRSVSTEQSQMGLFTKKQVWREGPRGWDRFWPIHFWPKIVF